MQTPPVINISPITPAKRWIVIVLIAIIGIPLFFAISPFATVPPGHVGVTSLFGKVDKSILMPGFHFINPLKKVEKIDCRNKELTLDNVTVPSQDQLTTSIDVTVKWRVDRHKASQAFDETGDGQALERVHLIPKVRSLMREAGKGIANAEDFYKDEVQISMQNRILEGLQSLADKGVLVEDVLLRSFSLPRMIVQGVEEKKRQKQLAERQIEELKRFTTEQEQKQVQAKAEKLAAIEEAAKRRALADAKAYEIIAEAKARAEALRLEGESLRNNPEVISLRSILRWNGELPRVLLGGKTIPFIHMGDVQKEIKN